MNNAARALTSVLFCGLAVSPVLASGRPVPHLELAGRTEVAGVSIQPIMVRALQQAWAGFSQPGTVSEAPSMGVHIERARLRVRSDSSVATASASARRVGAEAGAWSDGTYVLHLEGTTRFRQDAESAPVVRDFRVKVARTVRFPVAHRCRSYSSIWTIGDGVGESCPPDIEAMVRNAATELVRRTLAESPR